MGPLKNQMIETPNAHAFLPRAVAPTFWLPGTTVPFGGGAALELIGASKPRTTADPRTQLIRTP